MPKLELAKQARNAAAESVVDALRIATEARADTPSPPPTMTGNIPPDEGLVRIGITMPQEVYDRVGDAQYVLQKARRRISVSGFVEVAVMELLARDSAEILSAVQRHGGVQRRDGRRKI
jgi:hypothetical protein